MSLAWLAQGLEEYKIKYSCALNKVKSKLTALASQRMTVLSADPDIKVLENGRNCTLFTESACARKVVRHRELPKSQTFTWKTRQIINFWKELEKTNISYSIIHARGSKMVARWMPGNSPDGMAVLIEGFDTFPIYWIPKHDCAVTTSCGQMTSTIVECGAWDPILMSFGSEEILSRSTAFHRNCPHFPRLIIGCCDQSGLWRMQTNTAEKMFAFLLSDKYERTFLILISLTC